MLDIVVTRLLFRVEFAFMALMTVLELLYFLELTD